MVAEARVEALKSRHAELDNALTQEVGRPHPDEAMLTALKRQKLKVKDELFRLDSRG
ncbi:YdcH family protein [Roseospirillum parvum]|uniref:DUF465 domain-containing protein n=1 Tax=Roseospirillum parvum TaxID=83401 RepID=A0A1G7VA38_9PROT|nr:YdcH family protein [Roseospirillum parvum]SDG56682.1 hypothetical protein SAMN05421742_101594 [Roseospirillum parvum]